MTKKINVKRISIDFPDHILNQIDKICDENFITRRKWFIDAANEKLEKDNLNKIDMIVRK
jgi:metal-responsive CopG/Arc/MetJ family transcriptional regulator